MLGLFFPPLLKMFRVWKDHHSKTVIHIPGCPNTSNKAAANCACPKRLVFKTVDSYIGKLRAVFNEAGRSGDWNGLLGFGNPAASTAVQSYLKAISEEQLRAHIVPKQAVPFFFCQSFCF